MYVKHTVEQVDYVKSANVWPLLNKSQSQSMLNSNFYYDFQHNIRVLEFYVGGKDVLLQ